MSTVQPFPAEIDQYVQQRQKQSKAVRERNEAQYDPVGIRDRLLARKANVGRVESDL